MPPPAELETIPEPPSLTGDALDLWLADLEVMRLRRRAGSPDHRVAAMCSRGMLLWVEFRRRIRRDAPIDGDPRVVDFLAVVRGALQEIDRAALAQQAALEELHHEVAGLLGGVVPTTTIPAMPSALALVDAAIARHLQAHGRALP